MYKISCHIKGDIIEDIGIPMLFECGYKELVKNLGGVAIQNHYKPKEIQLQKEFWILFTDEDQNDFFGPFSSVKDVLSHPFFKK